MAKQATEFGFDGGDTWAFGPASKGPRLRPAPRRKPESASEPGFDPVVETLLPADAPDGIGASEKVQPEEVEAGPSRPSADDPAPAPQPAPIPAEPFEEPADERDMWDQLPAEPRRGNRRYVGKHRA